MNLAVRWHIRGMLILLLAGLALSLVPWRAQAASPYQASGNGGLRVDGAVINVVLAPGETYVHHLLVSSDPQASEMDIRIEARGFGETNDGSFLALKADQDASPYSGREFVLSISRPSFQLAPGASIPVDVSISLPAGASPDSRYATLLVYNQAGNGGGQVASQVSLLIPVVITPRGAIMNRTGAITEVQLGSAQVGKPIQVRFTLRNTGNRHYKVQGKVIIRDPDDQGVETLVLPVTGLSILPTFSQVLTVTSAPLSLVKPGAYSAEIILTTEDGTLVASQKVTQIQPTQQPTYTVSPTTQVVHHNRPTATTTATLRSITGGWSSATPVLQIPITGSSPTPQATNVSSTVMLPTPTATVTLAALAGPIRPIKTPPAQIEGGTSPFWLWLVIIAVAVEMFFLVVFLKKKRPQLFQLNR